MTTATASPFSAAYEFGFQPSAASSSPEPQTTINQVEGVVAGGWYDHPGIALFALVGVAALALERTTRPIASAGAHARVGSAEGEIEGDL